MVNTVTEAVAGRLAEFVSARQVAGRVPFPALATDKSAENGVLLARVIWGAARLAEDDIYRAPRYNKGIMNGLDPVVIATGNNWDDRLFY